MTGLELFNIAREARKDPVILNEKTYTAVNIFIRERKLFVASRETTGTWQDWAFNFLFFKAFGYHLGFLIKAKSVYLQVLKEMGKQDKSLYDEIIFTGYSQGGAIANIFFERFLTKNIIDKPIGGFTFAAPRVFSIWKALTLRKRFKIIKRYFVNWDLVPRVPPFIFGFMHTGEAIKLKEKDFINIKDVFNYHFPSNYKEELNEDKTTF